MSMNAIDREKLLEFLRVEIDLSTGNDPVLKADKWAFQLIYKEVESGRLDKESTIPNESDEDFHPQFKVDAYGNLSRVSK